MAAVETARGPIDPDSAGTTLMHEHVFVLTPDAMHHYGEQWWDEQERVTDAVTKHIPHDVPPALRGQGVHDPHRYFSAKE